MTRVTRLPLFHRVCLINGAVFLAGTLALAVAPVTVSSQVLLSEAVVLALGFAVIVVTNALLLRGSLAPLDRLARTMDAAELGETELGDTGLGETGLGEGGTPASGVGGLGADLERSFAAMMARLESERLAGLERSLAATEAERTRIARELHDEIGQSLTVVLLGVSRAADQAPPALAAELTELRETTRAALEDVRGVARSLRPDLLADLGLHAALVALSRDIAQHAGLRVRRGIAVGLPDVPAPVELAVYRVAQEALTNVVRHAGATEVEVALQRRDHGLMLVVADNGRGLGAAPAGSGIRGMRERAALAGGELLLSPRPGGGTEVRLVLGAPAAPGGTGAR